MSVRVLFVEDDETLFQLYLDAFTDDEQFFPNFVHDGKEAIDRIRDTAVDVIVTDLCMPHLDGMEMLRQMRGNGVDCPVIVVTGYPEMSSEEERVALGIRRLLKKPVSLNVLKREILSVAGT